MTALGVAAALCLAGGDWSVRYAATQAEVGALVFEAPAEGRLAAFDLTPPPPPARTGARVLLWGSAALVVGGIAGMLLSPECVTRDARERCVDRQGSDAIYPAIVVVGLSALAAGTFHYGRDVSFEGPSSTTSQSKAK